MVIDRDGKHIARQWDREIEDENRRLAASRDDGPWRRVVWAALWVLWLGLLAVTFAVIHPLRW